MESTSETIPKLQTRKPLMYLVTIGSVVVGGALGYAYYHFIGCQSGACPITANPYMSTLYGAVMGFLIGGGIGR